MKRAAFSLLAAGTLWAGLMIGSTSPVHPDIPPPPVTHDQPPKPFFNPDVTLDTSQVRDLR